MKLLNALAAIRDVKDFRLRNFMRSQGLDATQPVLFYRELIKEARQIAALEDKHRRVANQASALQRDVAALGGEKERLEIFLEEAEQRASTRISLAERRAHEAATQLSLAAHHLNSALNAAASSEELMKSLIAFLASKCDRDTVRKISDLSFRLWLEAFDQRHSPESANSSESDRATELREILRNKLRQCLALTGEELYYAMFYRAIWITRCSSCGDRAFPEDGIAWRHLRCPG